MRHVSQKGQRVLKDAAGLKEQLEEVYARWEAAERVRELQRQHDVDTLHSVLSVEEGRNKPLPPVPAPGPLPNGTRAYWVVSTVVDRLAVLLVLARTAATKVAQSLSRIPQV